MRHMKIVILLCLLSLVGIAEAKPKPGTDPSAPDAPVKTPAAPADTAPKQVDVSADDSLEWYQDQNIYVARGNAKAIRGDTTIEADVLTAHERDKPVDANGKKIPNATPDKTKTAKTASSPTDPSGGDIDKMTAEGNVRIIGPKQRVYGDHAVDDLDQHVSVITGKNLRYETDKEVVTAQDSLEYWDEKKLAIARGHAVATQPDRHVEGDVLTAEFRDAPNGQTEMTKMTALGHVVVVTKGDVSLGDKAVYDVSRNIAILTGNVRITREDGTQLTGDVGEVDFNTNQSRLMNDGTGRVRALLTSRSTDKATGPSTAKPAATTVSTGATP